MKVVIGVVVAVIVIWLGYTALTPSDTGPIKIGFIGPLTGDAAGIGENMRVGVEIARDEINSAGGVSGRQIEIIFEDGQCGPKEAVNAGNKLINIDKVVAIIGGACSSETLAVAPLAEQARVVLISAASTNPKITEAGDYVFRVVPSDSFQGSFAAEYVKETLGKAKVAVLKCLSDFCVGVSDVFKQSFQEAGGQIVADEAYEQDSRDLRSQLTKIRAVNPEAIYFVGYTEGTIIGLRQLKELGIKADTFGTDGWSDPKIWQEAGASGEGAMYVEPANKNLPENFISEMNKRTGDKEINVYAPRSYDALNIIISLIKERGVKGEVIKSALYNVKNYQGIADNYTFDQSGDILGARYVVKRVTNGVGKVVE